MRNATVRAVSVPARPEKTQAVLHVLNAVATPYERTEDLAGTLAMHMQSAELALREGRTPELAAYCHKIALVYYRIGDNVKALSYIRQSLALREQPEDRSGYASDLHLLGTIYLAMNRTDDAFPIVQQAVEIFETSDNRESLVDACICLGRIYSRSPETTAAMHCYRRAYAMALDMKNQGQIAYSLYCIGELLVHKKRYLSAGRFLEAARDIADRTTGNRHLQYIICGRLAAVYEVQGKIAEALECSQIHDLLNEEIFGYERQRAISQVHMRYAVGKIEQESERYRLMAEALETDIRHRERMLASTVSSITEKSALMKKLHAHLQEALRSRGSRTALLRALLREVREHMSQRQDWQQFEQLFEEVHRDFMAKLSRLFPSVSPTEIRICALLKANFSSKEIASLLSLSEHTIATHRYSIRKKLGIGNRASITTYLNSL